MAIGELGLYFEDLDGLTYCCRFIPNREGVDLTASYSLLHSEGSPSTPSKAKKRIPHGELHFQRSML